MNKKQILYIAAMFGLTALILCSDQINSVHANRYEVNYLLAALQLFCKLILPCLLGSVIAKVSADWIKGEGLSAFHIHKHFVYLIIELLAAYILFMLYPIICIILGTGIPEKIVSYMLFAADHLYLYILIYFLVTLGVIKACKSKSFMKG